MDDMYVGAMKVRMIVRESHSLKDKRQVLNSIKDKLKNTAKFYILLCRFLQKSCLFDCGFSKLTF